MSARAVLGVYATALGFLALLAGLLFLTAIFATNKGDWTPAAAVAAVGLVVYALGRRLTRQDRDEAEEEEALKELRPRRHSGAL